MRRPTRFWYAVQRAETFNRINYNISVINVLEKYMILSIIVLYLKLNTTVLENSGLPNVFPSYARNGNC